MSGLAYSGSTVSGLAHIMGPVLSKVSALSGATCLGEGPHLKSPSQNYKVLVQNHVLVFLGITPNMLFFSGMVDTLNIKQIKHFNPPTKADTSQK